MSNRKLGMVVFTVTLVLGLLANSVVFLVGVGLAAFVLALVHEPIAAILLASFLGLTLLCRAIWSQVRF